MEPVVEAEGVVGASARAHAAARVLSIDRLRVMVSAAVVSVHATIGAASPIFATLAVQDRVASNMVRSIVAGFSVNSFLIIAFLLMYRSVEKGAPYQQVLWKRVSRVAPAFLFWSGAYVLLRFLGRGELPALSEVPGIVFLGDAADHLYYVPMLLALTAAYPLLLRASRTPVLAIGGALVLSAVVHRWGADVSSVSPFVALPIGALGVVVFPILGLVIARSWGGPVPPARLRPWVIAVGAVTVVATTVVIARGMSREAELGVALARDPIWWACELLRGVAVSVTMLALVGRDSKVVAVLAPLTFGIYLVHPIFIVGLRLVETRFLGSGNGALLILPNAVMAFVGSATLVYTMQRTALRRLVS